MVKPAALEEAGPQPSVPLVVCRIPASDHCGMCAIASLNLACSVCAALPGQGEGWGEG